MGRQIVRERVTTNSGVTDFSAASTCPKVPTRTTVLLPELPELPGTVLLPELLYYYINTAFCYYPIIIVAWKKKRMTNNVKEKKAPVAKFQRIRLPSTIEGLPQCIYLWIVITYSKGRDQLGKVANPARGQLNRGNEYFPVPVRA